ncbi:Crp/Fnr family transcriptional regulator [Alkalibacillus salilacus]|uniref:CRP/FNR family transcriptional regulator n=1 Tax=Alkalibacillus salilacus TaxID=284582 RepID=A0ABT9VBC8_9BACI|nr:Crp/Fnr family transcriptional regulator [Alkalibacillus salilacus]MDQ0158274.1 CRP/FNR family transcriptional regulator [Alkalibacillus salilacus]
MRTISCSCGGQNVCIQSVPIFNHLDMNEMKKIASASQHYLYEKGEWLTHPDDESEQLYIVYNGAVKVYRLSENGKEQVIRILYSGDFTGDISLFAGTPSDYFAEALEPSRICVIDRSSLEMFIENYPKIGLKMIKSYTLRLEATEKQLSDLTAEHIDTRLANYLLNQIKREENHTIHLKLSKKDLASFLGTTPETLSRKLGQFQQAGWIELIENKTIHVKDQNALETIET